MRRMIKGEEVTQENSGMSKGEWREFMAVIEGDRQFAKFPKLIYLNGLQFLQAGRLNLKV